VVRAMCAKNRYNRMTYPQSDQIIRVSVSEPIS
jgi:hypothetical protein